jgi:predicted rRNA methylase YqxC with S4 and FtsJ domains
VLADVTRAAAEVGLERRAVSESPITGAQGNKEFLMLLTPLLTVEPPPAREQ